AGLFGVAGGTVQVGDGWRGRRFWWGMVVARWGLEVGYGMLHNRGPGQQEVRWGSRHRHQPSQRDRPRPCEAEGGRHQTSGPKIAPQPNRTSGLSARARSTRNVTGIDTGRVD